MEQVTVTPWLLAEIPYPLLFSSDHQGSVMQWADGDEDIRNWPFEGISHEMLQRRIWPNPFSKTDLASVEVHMSGGPYPISFDPLLQVMIVGFPLPTRYLDNDEIKNATYEFLELPFDSPGWTTRKERQALYRFARTYGLWIPFEPLTTYTVPQEPYDVQVKVSEIYAYWARLQREFRLSYITKQDELSQLITESLIGENDTDRSAPYRNSHHFHESEFSGKWLWWPELAKLWHEAASELQSMSPNEIDYTNKIYETRTLHQLLLDRLWKSCTAPSVSAELVARDGLYNQFRIYNTATNVEASYTCAVILYDLQEQLRRKIEEDTEGKRRNVPCMVSGCSGHITTNHKMYRWNQEVGSYWAYCRGNHANGEGVTKLLEIADDNPQHEDLAKWAANHREKDNRRKKR